MMLAQLKIGKFIMNLLPNKNLFIVTSALNTGIGIITPEDRFKQTIDTLVNLRQKVPDAIVMLADGSPFPVKEEYKREISKYANINAYFGENGPVKEFASSHRKSEAEIAMMFQAIMELKTNLDLARIMTNVKRIFKYSARSELTNDFDITKYDGLFGKYVFKKAIPSWMDETRKKSITDHLYITRFYSLCPSLIDNYLNTLQPILNNVMQHGIDTEHSHYMCIDKRYVVEFETLGVEGIMGGTGWKETY